MKEDVRRDNDEYMATWEFLLFAAFALVLTVPILIGHSPLGFLLFPVLITALATTAYVRDQRNLRRKEAMTPQKIFWAMCTRTSGCVLEDGHGGECKLAKGF